MVVFARLVIFIVAPQLTRTPENRSSTSRSVAGIGSRLVLRARSGVEVVGAATDDVLVRPSDDIVSSSTLPARSSTPNGLRDAG